MPGMTIGIEGMMGSLAWLGLAHCLWMGLAAPAVAAMVLRARPGLPGPVRHRILLGAFLIATIGPFAVGAAHREAAWRSSREAVGVVMFSASPTINALIGASMTGRRVRGGPIGRS